MLRVLMSKHPRYNYRLKDLFLHVFVLVNDWLEENKVRYGIVTLTLSNAAEYRLCTSLAAPS